MRLWTRRNYVFPVQPLIALLVPCALSRAHAAAQGADTFLNRVWDVGGVPTALAKGDLNGDGRDDFVTSTLAPGQLVSAVAGVGPKLTVAGATPIDSDLGLSLVLGDLNGDGNLDAVLSLATTKKLIVASSDGSGVFSVLSTTTLPIAATSLALGDFDPDGVLDLAAGFLLPAPVEIRKGGAGATFGAPTTLPGSALGAAVAIHDFGGDGLLDLLIARRDAMGGSLWAGAGARSFQLVQNLVLGAFTNQILLGDFQGDGVMDALFLPTPPSVVSPPQIKSIALGNGSGSFLAPSLEPSEGNLGAAADWNLDGRTDAVIAQLVPFAGSRLYVTNAMPNGSFVQVDVNLSTNANGIAISDLQGDGWPDAVVSSGNIRGLAVLEGTGSTGFAARSAIAYSTFAAREAHAGDITNDGIPDAIWEMFSSMQPDNKYIALTYGVPFGDLTPGIILDAQQNYRRADVADINHDGNLDIVATQELRLAAFLGTGSGTFQLGQSTQPELANATGICIADFDADGTNEIMISRPSETRIVRWLGGSPPSFQTDWVTSTTSQFSTLKAGDVNSDGRIDAVGVASTGISAVLTQSGAAPQLGPELAVSGVARISLGEWNADSAADVVLIFENTLTDLRIVHADGTGGFQFSPITLSGFPQSDATFVDIDGDAHLDIVATARAQSGTQVLRGDGQGTIRATDHFLSGLWLPDRQAVLDVNLDGRPDYVARDAASDRILTTLNQSHVTAGTVPFGTASGGCAGSMTAAATANPQLGSVNFALVTANAPEFGLGFVAICDGQLLTPSDVFGVGIFMNIDLLNATGLVAATVKCDAAGVIAVPVPLPSDPNLAGLNLFAQFVFAEPFLASCGNSPYGLVASRGLSFTLLP
ncbi:MAG: VCBS repeat-containing protein [Planctomycetes bacterium]|nr:VCBS repeat-containing protein [Planctomycetota bacterium]